MTDSVQSYQLRAIEYNGGATYAAGEALVDQGGYFARAGFLTRVDASGATAWTIVLNFSGWQDGFDGLETDGVSVYAVGRGFQVYLPDFVSNVGYGLIAKYDAATGMFVSARTLGSSARWSGFSAFSVQGATAIGFGFRQDPSTSVREGWLVDMTAP